MPQEMVQEAVEIITMSVDKFINVKNYEVSNFQLSWGGIRCRSIENPSQKNGRGRHTSL